MERERDRLLSTERWTDRFALITSSEQRAGELARNRQIVFGLAAVTAGAGFILGAMLMLSTHECSSDSNKTNRE